MWRLAQLWRHALNFTAEVVLDGMAKAGAKGRCTQMGRAAMSLDLQVLTHNYYVYYITQLNKKCYTLEYTSCLPGC